MPKRVDRNQREVVERLRNNGIKVFHTHAVGKGFPDLVCSYGMATALVEVKMPGNGPNRKQVDFYGDHGGLCVIVRTDEDCDDLADLLKLVNRTLVNCGIKIANNLEFK